MITDVEDFFAMGCGRCARFDTPDCSARRWGDGLARLRRVCLAAGLSETAKWGHPCYMHAGRNVAIMGAFRDHFRLTFFEAGLLADPDGLLERQGPNTAQPDAIRFKNPAEVDERLTALRVLIAQAMDHAAAGRRAPKPERADEMPAELADALDADPELAAAFGALTPGRRRSYLLHVGGAKSAATRVARIGKCRDRILAGKGATER